MIEKPSTAERILTSGWHLGLFLVGLWEARHHRSKVGKVLAYGFALWHLDATIADARGVECLAKKMLRRAADCEQARMYAGNT